MVLRRRALILLLLAIFAQWSLPAHAASVKKASLGRQQVGRQIRAGQLRQLIEQRAIRRMCGHHVDLPAVRRNVEAERNGLR
jgi:predicted RNA-binding protein